MSNFSMALFERAVSQLFPPVITVAAALLFYSLVRRFTRVLVHHQQVTPVMALRMRLAVRWVLVGATTLIVLQQTGIFGQAWALLSAIIAALAVAFVASWSMLSNATCALLILVYRPFRMGDEIELLEADGKVVVRGRVVDLNLLYTTVQEDNEAVVRVPNNVFIQKYARVRRQGRAPDPSRDSKEPFFTITPGTHSAYRAPAPDKANNEQAGRS